MLTFNYSHVLDDKSVGLIVYYVRMISCPQKDSKSKYKTPKPNGRKK